MRAMIAFLLTAMTLPAAGAPCAYVDPQGDRLVFVRDGDNTVQVMWNGGRKTTCTWGVTGGTPYEDIECDDGTKAGFFFGSLTRTGTDQDILSFNDDLWYRECK